MQTEILGSLQFLGKSFVETGMPVVIDLDRDIDLRVVASPNCFDVAFRYSICKIFWPYASRAFGVFRNGLHSRNTLTDKALQSALLETRINLF
jgi:hypothetical protein